jgi:D-alanyl-D-alanine carboxypeptidase (penicillin-binding protein 5/6)
VPLTRRQVYRRRRTVVFGGGALVLATGFYLPITLLAPLQSVEAHVVPYEAPTVVPADLDFPGYGSAGIGAIGYPGVLASAGSADPQPIASITKIVTALVVLDAKPLAQNEAGPAITFGELDEQFYADQLAQNGSVKSVYAGQVISERDALTVMLLASANNYAQSLASWAFGSEEAYLGAARAWLDREGLTGTSVTEPSGILPSNTSTVPDLIELAKRVIADPVLSTIVATQTADVPDVGVVTNRNELLGIAGIDGIKTGTLDESGACLLFSADETVGAQTVTIVGVVLGGPDHGTINAAIQGLIAQATSGFREVQLTTAGEPFATYDTAWGDEAEAVAAEDLALAVWSPTPVTVSMDAGKVRLAESGSSVGEVRFTVGDRELTVPLELDATIDDPGPWWRLTNPEKLF